MSAADAFFDTSVLLYLISSDGAKADRVEELLSRSGVLNTQVLNEFAAVALRKRVLSLPEIREVLADLRTLCVAQPQTLAVHDRGLEIAARYSFALYDSMIVAAALEAGCRKLYSEDLQHEQVVEQRLTVINPFRKPGAAIRRRG
jgi:predicted nucleic acid-binding protein